MLFWFSFCALLVAAAQGLLIQEVLIDPGATDKLRSQYIYIGNPKAQHLKDLKMLNMDNTSMMKVSTISGGSGRNVTIVTYPSNEDVFVSGAVNSGNGWETKQIKTIYDVWSSVGQRKGNFWDCGANIGTWSLPVALDFRGTRSKVISIEGMPGIADHLRAGILANTADNVVLFPYAVGQPLKQDNITMIEDSHNKGGSAVEGNNKNNHVSDTKFTVGFTTVDAILRVEPAMKNILVAKIDIEGNEGRMIEGAQELFTKYPPCRVVIELRNDLLKPAGTNASYVTAQLLTFGYELIGDMGDVHSRSNFLFQQRNMSACVARLS